MQSAADRNTADAPHCPVIHGSSMRIDKSDVLAVPMPKRMVVQYGRDGSGATELKLFYADKEVSFDEPHLFPFGEALAREARFTAGDALTWGQDYDWQEISACLMTLIESGILVRVTEGAIEPAVAHDRERPSPLPPAQAERPSDWSDMEAITLELTGRAVEPGWLELVVPVFRIAHMALDADNRQVGEANVFPRALRLDRPTEWMACTYAGTRYLDPKPMNLTALRSMRSHWTQMMMALSIIRQHYLTRYPNLPVPMPVGAIERLATLVLAVPTYQLLKPEGNVRNGSLHPALSSLFRVTDGLRTVIHQMLFVPVGEPTRHPHEATTAEEILDYAERNFSFHSETGVCAGPRHFVREFLEIFVEGKPPPALPDFAFDADVASALADLGEAFDYGLEGLRAHAAVFAFWPRMARAYEKIARVISDAHSQAVGFDALHAAMQAHLITAERSTYLGTEKWRSDRDAVYAEMFEACGEGLGQPGVMLPATTSASLKPDLLNLAETITVRLAERHAVFASNQDAARTLAATLAAFAGDTKALLSAATQCQARVNAKLRRKAPARSFEAKDINVHVRLQGPQQGRRLPFLFDEIEKLFGLSFEIDSEDISLSGTEARFPT